MPVERVPVVHKFGIISHTQRLTLEDRLAKKSLATKPPRTFSRTRRLPYEVTEDFIAKFNDSNEDDRKELEGFALKMISRVKRRAGIIAGGQGDHVDLAKSWTELGLLAQCTNRQVQEESLELLITSLGHAPPAADQVPSLFYLAKSCLHWLRKCGITQSCLRTAELKLIRMGHLAFSRLYYHNMTQDLKEYQDEKCSLLQYLSGFPEEHEAAYKSFPGVLLAVRYIQEVGQLICTGCEEPKQAESLVVETLPDTGATHKTETTNQDKQGVTAAPVGNTTEGGRVGLTLLLEEEEEEQGNGDLVQVQSFLPLRYFLMIAWLVGAECHHQSVCSSYNYDKSLLYLCRMDVCCAFQVLTEVSKRDIAVLRTFQALAAGMFTKPAEISEVHARHIHVCNNCMSTITGHQSLSSPDLHDDGFKLNQERTRSTSGFSSAAKTPSFVKGLRDFANLGLENDKANQSEHVAESIKSRNILSDTSEASFADVSSEESEHHERSGFVRGNSARNLSKTNKKTKRTIAVEAESSSESEEEIEKPLKSQIKKSNQTNIQEKETHGSTRAHGGIAVRFNVRQTEFSDPGAGVPAVRMERSVTKESLFSVPTRDSSVTLQLEDEDDRISVKTGTSQLSSPPGLTGWRWELAYLYTDCMTSVCLNGQSSTIQKTALLGSEANRKVTLYGKRHDMVHEGLGLLDLLKLNFSANQVPQFAHKDWSWRVRFAAVQGLVRICRQCSDDATKDGIRGVAWNQLMRHHSQERDVRVLEAWKLAQIESGLDNKIPSLDVINSSFPTWAASRLSAVLLPSLPPVVPPSSRSKSRARTSRSRPTAPVVKRGPKRPSLRQEILLATAAREPQPDYNSRMNHDLMLVIEDQWRKQLHEEQKKEEEERKIEEATKVEVIVRKDRRRTIQGSGVGDNKRKENGGGEV
ncbi:transmembrane protein 232-like [Stylophora pistillata]|uniref:transmembrane protein 232-like n=1 Tax=Stylophora pistillata TaxID=50429 RepID=UPI000C03AF2F|nr:transmembrane protein 232-like [Stylophora pistillata]